MTSPYLPFTYPVETFSSECARYGYRRASSLNNLCPSPDMSPRSPWMRRGHRVSYQHQSVEVLRRPEIGVDEENLSDGRPLTTLLGYEVMEERAKFTVYKILVKRAPNECWVIFRRYADFSRLNDKLKEMFPKFRLTLPPKRWFRDNYDMNFLQERLLGLQDFLQNLVAHEDVTNCDLVRGFLCLDDPPGPFDSLEESRAYCETLEETNHRLQRELLAKQKEIEALRRSLEDRELRIGELERIKSGLFSTQKEMKSVHSESDADTGVNTDPETEQMFKATGTDCVRNPDRRFQILWPKGSRGARWNGPATGPHDCVSFQGSAALLEDQGQRSENLDGDGPQLVMWSEMLFYWNQIKS